MTCSICCNDYNKSINSKIICPIGSCNFDACKKCIRQYLISTSKDPHCMSCKAQWNEQFVIEKLNKSFWETDYKSHRSNILTDIEISKIPETIQYAENFSKLEKLTNEKSNIKKEIKELFAQLNVLKQKVRVIDRTMHNIKYNTDDKERKKFIMPCQHNDCKGYLSTQYKCGLCELYTCPDCLEVIGPNKTDHHVCNLDSVKSAEEIKKTTKPCPNCGERIFKISGCDQMWCTECKIAFSWNTGAIETNKIHNPHYFEYVRNNGTLMRDPDDVQCGGLLQFYYISSQILVYLTSGTLYESTRSDKNKYLQDIEKKFEKFYGTISHITYNDIPNIRRKINEFIDQKELRANYILKKITKDELTKQLYSKDKQRRKNQEILHIYEIISAYGIEFFRNLIDDKDIKIFINSPLFFNMKKGAISKEEIEKIFNSFKIYIENVLNQVLNLFDYCNNQMAIISATYNLTVMQLNKTTFGITTDKYSTRDLKYLNKKSSSQASCSSDPI